MSRHHRAITAILIACPCTNTVHAIATATHTLTTTSHAVATGATHAMATNLAHSSSRALATCVAETCPSRSPSAP